jgi:hypothetical protein
MIGHNNDGKGVVKAIHKVRPIAGKRVAMLGAVAQDAPWRLNSLARGPGV